MNEGAFARCWNTSFPDRFRILPEAARHQAYCSEHYRADWSAAVHDQAGEARALLVAKEGATPGTAHISALAGDPLAAHRLVHESLLRMRRGGIETVHFGSDRDHFWPGAPTTVSWLLEVLTAAGFTLATEVYDLGRDLRGYSPVSRAASHGALTVRCSTSDVRALGRFLAREFPGRWESDTMRKVSEDPGDVFLLVVDGTIRGFAVTQDPRSQRPHAGAVFRSGLGPDWCALGPIGVAASFRGKGLGHALLSEALLALRESGGQRCTIDWTVLQDFYGRHGFRPTAAYRAAELRLAPVS